MSSVSQARDSFVLTMSKTLVRRSSILPPPERSPSVRRQSASTCLQHRQHLMTLDRRVVRGAVVDKFEVHDAVMSAAARRHLLRVDHIARRKKFIAGVKDYEYRIRNPTVVKPPPPPPVVECHLEALTKPDDDPILLSTMFLSVPEPPAFEPSCITEEMETQVDCHYLFDFDMEVQPYVESIVGDVVRQAMFEVIDEDELESEFARRKYFLDRKAGLEAEILRLRERERRYEKEKQLQKQQLAQALALQKEMEAAVAAVLHVKGAVGDNLPRVLEGLRTTGHLLESIRSDVERRYMPSLWTDLANKSSHRQGGHDILNDMLSDIVHMRAALYSLIGEEEKIKRDDDHDDVEIVGMLRKDTISYISSRGMSQDWRPEDMGKKLSLLPQRVSTYDIDEDKNVSVLEMDITWTQVITQKDVWEKHKSVVSKSNLAESAPPDQGIIQTRSES